MRASRAAVLVAAAAAATLSFAAGTVSGSFNVGIRLVPPGAGVPGAQPAADSGICRSETLSERTGALVRVVCESGQFVSISPRPGRRFFGTHGGAFTFSFGPFFGSAQHSGDGVPAGGAGTIASFRVFSVEATDGPIDMLVSF